MGHQFQDVASMAPVSRNSAGQVYRYPGNRAKTYVFSEENFHLYQLLSPSKKNL
jgi:hypothetical protein